MEKRFYCIFFISLAIFYTLRIILLFYGRSYYIDIKLYELSSIRFTLSVIIDPTSLIFRSVVRLISLRVFIFAVKYIEGDTYSVRFFWILFLFVVSINILIFSGSLFFLLIGWDGLGVSSFALIIYYSCYDSLMAGYITLIINRLGDVLIVCSCCLFVFLGNFSIIIYSQERVLLIFILRVAALTKSAQYPFRSWLPAAIAAPTPVSALVHSSTLVTAGIYLIIRLVSRGRLHISNNLTLILMIVGSLTCLLGSLGACFENDLKKIIALSTLSQLGVIIYSLGMGNSNLALFHLFRHAIFKALLFISAGIILIIRYGCQDIRLLGGILKNIPLVSFFFVLRGLCLAGVPFLRGFFTKHIILEIIIYGRKSLILGFIFIIFGRLITVFYRTRLIKILFIGPSYQVIFTEMFNDFRNKIFLIFPICLLGFFRVLGGKFIFGLNINFSEYCFLSRGYNFLLNLLLPFGFIIAIVLSFKKRYFIRSIFFLWPLFLRRRKLLTNLEKNIRNLDLIWLEPKNLIKDISLTVSWNFNFLFGWPSLRNWAIIKSIIIFLFLLIFGVRFII